MDIKKKIEELPIKLARKWVGVPYAILVVLCAGASYNLFAYFQQIGAAQGYGSETMTTIKYVVLFGYYLGLIPGLVLKTLEPTLTFIVAAIQALIAFSVLGYLAENGEGDTFNWFVMMFMLFIGSMSGAIGTVGAIVTTVKNFPKMAGMLIVVIMVSYYKVAPYFEFSVRSAFFAEASLMWYFIGVGGVMAVVFIGAAFIIADADIDEKIEGVLKDIDRLAMLIFVVVEVLFLISYYVVSIILEDWFIGAILFLSFIFLNFIALAAAVGIIVAKVKSMKPADFLGKRDPFADVKFQDYLGKIKYICLIIASFLVIGVTQTYNFNIFQIAFSLGAVDSADNALDAFWISDMLARIAGGLFAYFLTKQVNGYLFAVLAGGNAAIGFGLAILSDSLGASLFWGASIMIGISNGLFWVIAPMIVMEDAGPDNFGLNWGFVLFANVFGMLIFGEGFDLWYEYQGGDQCSGLNCVLLSFILFGLFCLIGAGLAYYGYMNDEDEKKSKGGAKKDDKKADKGKGKGKDKAKSKDKKAGTKDKKAGSKSKPKSKPKSKSKTKK